MAQAGQLTIIRAGRLIDVAARRVESDRAVLVRGDRIEDVVPLERATAEGGRVIDLSEHMVLPGLFDVHTHLIGEVDTGRGYASLIDRSAEQEMRAGVDNARATLLAGFTTVRDVGTFRAFLDVALREAIDRGGVAGPRMVCAGAYVTVPGGGGDITGLLPEVDATVPADFRVGVAKGVDEVREAVRRILEGGADFIKVIATGAVFTEGTTPGASEFSEEEIRAAVEEADAQGVHVAAHAHGAEGIKRAVRAGVRSIEHGSFIDDEAIALMAEHGTYLVADIYNGDYTADAGPELGYSPEVLRKNEETTAVQREGFERAVKAGVRMAFGTDSGIYPHGLNGRQFAYMARHGMTPIQAIRTATIDAAEMLGWSNRLGSIEPGKLADLIAVDGDPLQDVSLLEDVAFVMKAGHVVKSEAGAGPIQA